MTEWAPTPLVLTEWEAKCIHKEMFHLSEEYGDLFSRLDQYLFECRLNRNPEVIESLKRAASDLKGDRLIEREI
ncbi:hypothetical protein SEA_WEASELS2_240 [Rhodococcus phage Weasels2]|uniref:Uncharacterized protein n=1 Tax=Rhodococcus phage Weasels2 TaxID=1897437 RepID=A0A1I9SAL2_9CAUD|nr:hypothetical protein FDH04_gp176 [Rhodococcus phage Weasels2]AOZ63818.1 hypothetical protein SEA_WEASELS2_240 [Rhodococcus phage Weasels2]